MCYTSMAFKAYLDHSSECTFNLCMNVSYSETGQVPPLVTGRMTASHGIAISGVHRFGRL